MTLTSVVLPAPFGPMRPWIDPFSSSSDTPSTARTPPKWRWTSSRRRSTGPGTRPPRRPNDRQAAPADHPLRPEDDDGDQEDSAENIDVRARLQKDVRQERDDESAGKGTEDKTAAAEDGEGKDLH